MLAILVTALALCVGCTYTDGGEDTVEVTSPPPDPPALTTKEDPVPKFVSKTESGVDTRFVLSYHGREIHILAGESGLFGMKVMADESETSWENLWLTFSPRRVRPREHGEDELALESELSLDFVPEELRGYVQDAQQLALHLAPQTPRTGEEAASPPRARNVIRDIKLPPVAANELAIFARTDKLAVTQNLKVHTPDMPGEPGKSHIQFEEFASSITHIPAGLWLSFKVVVRRRSTTFFVLRDVEGNYTRYVESYASVSNARFPNVLQQLVTYKSGIFSATYYEPVSGDPLILSKDLRTVAGITRSMLDENLLQPPEALRHELYVLTTLLAEREKVNDYKIQREGPRGVEPLLQEFEGGS